MTDYYVANAVHGGSDANNGLTSLLPFATQAKLFASAFLAPDDVVRFYGGDLWEEQATIRTVGNLGGTQGHLVTWTSYGDPRRPIFSAADRPAFAFDSVVAGGDRYKVVALGWTPLHAHREDGVRNYGTVRNLLQAASLVACTALHNWWYTGADFYVVVATGEVPQSTNLTIHVPRRLTCLNEFVDGQDYIKLQNLHFRFGNDNTGFYGQIHFGANSTTHDGVVYDNLLGEWGEKGVACDGLGTNSFAQQRVLTMTNCEWRFMHGHGLQLIFLSAGSRVDNVYSHGNGRQGCGFAARNSIISWSRFEDNANRLGLWTAPLVVQGFDQGLYVVGQVPNFDRAADNLVRDTIFKNNAKAGSSVDALCDRTTYLRCTSILNLLFGWQFEGGTTNSSAGTRLLNSVAWHNQKSALHVLNCHGPFECRNTQLYGNGLDGSQDLYVETNIGSWILHSGTGGVDAVWRHDHHIWDVTAVGDPSHNILTQVGSVALVQSTTASWFKSGAAGTEGSLYVRIVGNAGSTTMTCWCDPDWTQLILDYNNYTPVAERPVGHNIIRLAYSTTTINGTQTLAQLRALAPWLGSVKEVHGQQLNPAYVDSANGDFRLSAGSSSIDKGVAIAGINDGYSGSAPDIGLGEYSGSTNTPYSKGVDSVGLSPQDRSAVALSLPNAVGVLTIEPPGGQRVFVAGYTVSYSAAPTTAHTLTISSDQTWAEIVQTPIGAPTVRSVEFARPVQCPAGVQCVGVVREAGVGITSELVLRYFLA